MTAVKLHNSNQRTSSHEYDTQMKNNLAITRAAKNAIYLFLCAGGIAMLSRNRVIHPLNELFISGLGGQEYQSWVEHFLSGIAGPSLLLIAALTHTWIKNSIKNGHSNFKIILRLRSWILSLSGRTLYVTVVLLVAGLYVVGSGTWEYIQYCERGYFQLGQFMMDILGSLLAIRMLSPKGLELYFD